MADWFGVDVQESRAFDGVYARSNLASAVADDYLIFPQIDRDDPAFGRIIDQLMRMKLARIEIGDREVEIAVALGQAEQRRGDPSFRDFDFGAVTNDPEQSVVYYIRRGSLIKIGLTRRLRQRMAALMPDEILAVEPGDRETEYARHQQFDYLGVGREHFRDTPELRQHIGAILAKHGPPQVTYEPLRSVQ